MQTIPLQSIPSQTVKVVLGGQNFQLLIRQMTEGVFVDTNVNGEDIDLCVIARNVVPLICSLYLGILGNLIFIDTQGSLDPNYTGLGTRWQLIYLTQDEFVQSGLPQ